MGWNNGNVGERFDVLALWWTNVRVVLASWQQECNVPLPLQVGPAQRSRVRHKPVTLEAGHYDAEQEEA